MSALTELFAKDPTLANRTVQGIKSLYPDEQIRPVIRPHPLLLTDLKIRTKETGALRSFAPNRIQTKYLDAMLPNWRTDPTGMRGVRELDLKGRQFGFSTLIAGLYFLETYQTPYTTTVIVAQDSDTTTKIFETVRRFYDHLPKDRKMPTRYNSKFELTWPDIESSFLVGKAGTINFGRGFTVNNVHATEIPLWPQPHKLMAAIGESVPAAGNIICENTANGYGDWFQEEWEASYEHARDSIYRSYFLFWGDHEEYRISPDQYACRNQSLPTAALDYLREGPTESEQLLKDSLSLDDEQIMWRRWKAATLKEKLAQEYPNTPEEAFLVTGDPYFDKPWLNDLLVVLQSEANRPLEQAALLERLPRGEKTDPLREFIESGYLQLWKWPDPGKTYIVTADPSSGLNLQGRSDYCAVDVLCLEDWEQVGHFNAQVEPHRLARALAALAGWYNDGLIAVERNNHGHSVLNTLIHTIGVPLSYDSVWNGAYTGLYCHREYNQLKRSSDYIPGWPTTAKTKTQALDALQRAIAERTLILHSTATVKELRSFVHLPGGKAGGSGTAHDDRVSSLSIGCAIMQERSRPSGDYAAGGEAPKMEEPGTGYATDRVVSTWHPERPNPQDPYAGGGSAIGVPTGTFPSIPGARSTPERIV